MAVQDGIGVGVMGLGAVVSLVKLWLRLRFRLHRERERRSYLQTAGALPAGSRVQEQRDDGTRVTVDVGKTSRDESR